MSLNSRHVAAAKAMSALSHLIQELHGFQANGNTEQKVIDQIGALVTGYNVAFDIDLECEQIKEYNLRD